GQVVTTYARVPKPSSHPSGRLAHVRPHTAHAVWDSATSTSADNTDESRCIGIIGYPTFEQRPASGDDRDGDRREPSLSERVLDLHGRNHVGPQAVAIERHEHVRRQYTRLRESPPQAHGRVIDVVPFDLEE